MQKTQRDTKTTTGRERKERTNMSENRQDKANDVVLCHAVLCHAVPRCATLCVVHMNTSVVVAPPSLRLKTSRKLRDPTCIIACK
eukprot:COSAG06_NODE_2447_length_6864_cov_3.888101_7_plen_85_part_00